MYTRGRVANSDQDYRATESSDYLNLPMVTLVSRTSASASEIVVRRAAGSRSLAHRRRDDVRQGARAVGLSAVAGRGRRDHDGALLHAERPAHSASVGRHLRRVPDLRPTRAGREQGRTRSPISSTRIRGARCTAAAASSPIADSMVQSDGFNPTRLGRSIAARNLFDTYAQQFSRRGDTRISRAGGTDAGARAGISRSPTRCSAEFKAHRAEEPGPLRRGVVGEGPRFIKAMIHREIDMDLFGVAVAYQNLAKQRPAAAVRAGPVSARPSSSSNRSRQAQGEESR